MPNIFEFLNDIIKPWEEYSFSSPSSSLAEKLRARLKKIYFWSQKEHAIRYQPVLKELKNRPSSYQILEVGSGVLGLSRYIKREISGVDINTKGPRYGHMRLINANAWELPFNDGAFDLVVSMDMLEHIPREHRPKAVLELLRVSKRKIFLGFPSGNKAEEWESKARAVYNRVLEGYKNEIKKGDFINRNSFLEEHAGYVLPKAQEVHQYIQSSGEQFFNIQVIDNESVYVWYWGVLAHMKYSYTRWFFTTIIYILFFGLLENIKWGGVYRKIFVINKQGEDL